MVKRSNNPFLLFVMIGEVIQDAESAVELFYKEEPYQLVVESHLGEGDFVVCRSVDRRGESKGSANDKDEVADAGVHLFLKVLGESY